MDRDVSYEERSERLKPNAQSPQWARAREYPLNLEKLRDKLDTIKVFKAAAVPALSYFLGDDARKVLYEQLAMVEVD